VSALDRNDAVRPVGFRLNKVDGKLMGVCAGIADRFGIDATLVRVGFVAGALLGFGSLVVV
jgi:phage shock protein PspC (stress-responsive transcriptional regulator)